MKTFKTMVAEVAQPNSGDELNFKEKHVIDQILDPNAEEEQFTADKIKKFKNRADYEKGDDMAVYEGIALTRDLPGQENGDVDNDGDSDMADAQLRFRRHAEIKKKIIDEGVKFTIPESILTTERNAFHTAAADAHKAGKTHFAFSGKKYPVTMSKDAATTFAGKGKGLVEADMSDSQKKKREEIVLAMKKDAADLKKRYGDEWKTVMYATATKQAMSEAEQIDEISRKTLVSYARKAPESADDLEQHGRRMAKIGQSHKEMGKPVSANAIFQRAGEKIGKAGQRRQYFQKALTKLEALDPVGQEDSDIDNDGKRTKSDAYLHARRKAIAKKLQQEGLVDVMMPAGGEFDSEPSHKAYKRKNKSKPHHAGESLRMAEGSKVEDVSIAKNGAGLKVFAGKTKRSQIDEAFKAGPLKLIDGSTINMTTEEAEALNSMFEGLNPSNREKMQSIMTANKKGYGDIVSFAKEVM
jgi:hypothetical protein